MHVKLHRAEMLDLMLPGSLANTRLHLDHMLCDMGSAKCPQVLALRRHHRPVKTLPSLPLDTSILGVGPANALPLALSLQIEGQQVPD